MSNGERDKHIKHRFEGVVVPPATVPCAFPECGNLGRMAFCSDHWQFTTWSRADIYYAKTPEERWTAIQTGIMQIALALDKVLSFKRREDRRVHEPEQIRLRRLQKKKAKGRRQDGR